jgi:hypothetical protein
MAKLSVYELDTLILVAIKAAINKYINLDNGAFGYARGEDGQDIEDPYEKYSLTDFERKTKLKRVFEAAEKAVEALIDNDFKYPSDYTLPPPEASKNQDVHTEHCCGQHKRCKYGDEYCPVANGQKAPSYPCNCDWM